MSELDLIDLAAVAPAAAPASLTELREAAGALLAPAGDTDPEVLIDYPDALTPPALLVIWDEPTIELPRTMGPCVYSARLAVLAIAGRIDPGPNVETLEGLISYVLGRMRGDPAGSWALQGVSTPREFIISGVHYLGARISYRAAVSL